MRFLNLKMKRPVNEQGSISVVVALSLFVFVGILAMVIDGGYLFVTKDKWQNNVEAVSMGGALNLCEADYESVCRTLAQENGLPSTESGDLTVSRGFYDEHDLYENFSNFKDFVAEDDDDFPRDASDNNLEYNNAVMVSLDTQVSTFFAGILGKDKVRVRARAVAYLRPLGMAALNEGSQIRIGPNTIFQNGDVYSNGDIKFQDLPIVISSFYGTRRYEKPEFVQTNLYAGGQVLECPAAPGRNCINVGWDAGDESKMDNAFSQSSRLSSLEVCDEDYIQSLKATATTVYEISDAATDTIFWGRNADNTGFLFDLSGNPESREVIFFDAQGNDVVISDRTYVLPHGGASHVLFGGHPSSSNGDRLGNVTFITNGDIILDRDWRATHILGDTGDRQAIIITSGRIRVVGREMDGIVFRCGGSFGTYSNSYATGMKKVRVIADGDILLYCCGATQCQNLLLGKWSGTTDFHFGPPCPYYNGAGLGMLERTGE